jgi:hypothetical protein
MPEKAPANRPETGAMRFGSDWRGAFIRGDDAFGYAQALEIILKGTPDPFSLTISRAVLESLLGVLKATNEHNEIENCQQLLEYMDCGPETYGPT